MYAIARDVTDSVRAEQELRDAKEQLEASVAERTRELGEAQWTRCSKSEHRFRALIEHSSDSITLIDAESAHPLLEPSVANVEGYEPEELVGPRRHRRAHPDDRPRLAGHLRQVLADPG